jgi:hypothetical protein
MLKHEMKDEHVDLADKHDTGNQYHLEYMKG